MASTVACRNGARTGDAVEVPVSELPVCRSAKELLAYDGQRVRLVGTYRKSMSQKKMNDPKLYFFGFVNIEVEGVASEYDPIAGSAEALVALDAGRRPDEEVERFADQRVVVEGRLVVKPPVDPTIAQPYPKPTLTEVGPVEAWTE